MSEEYGWNLLDRVLSDESTPEERTAFEAWLAESPDRRELLATLVEQRDAGKRFDVNAAWRAVAARTVQSASPTPAATPVARLDRHRRRTVRFGTLQRLAAAIVLVVLGGFAAWRMHWVLPNPAATREVAWHETSAPRGAHATITLADGSLVLLNAGSTIRYAADSASGPRDVYLTGEAYFTVTHDATRPFRVHAARATVQDVGTKFVVRAWGGTLDAIVVVTQGAVALTRDGTPSSDTAQLTAGMLGRVGASGPVVTRRVDVAKYTAWTEGRITFDDATLAEAVPTIERWYDVEIVVTDTALARHRVSAEFRDESLGDVLNALSVALNADVRREGRKVTFTPRGGAQ
jgi:transmembrane sensor